MSVTGSSGTGLGEAAALGGAEMKLEVLVLPVADVDRAKEFYSRLGWRLDADLAGEGFRLVQFTPPGSNCSVQFGENVTMAQPGSVQDSYLVVSDIGAVRAKLAELGVGVGETFHCSTGVMCRFRAQGAEERTSGPAPDRTTYGTFASFRDPDGNGWLLQEVTSRLPGRVDPVATSFGTAAELAGAMRRAEAAHGEHEKRTGVTDPNWPDWYAAFMVAEQCGDKLPS